MSLTDLLPTSVYGIIDFLFPLTSEAELAYEDDADTTEYIELHSEVVFLANTGTFTGCVEAVDVEAQRALVRYTDTNTRAEMLQWLSVEWLALAKVV